MSYFARVFAVILGLQLLGGCAGTNPVALGGFGQSEFTPDAAAGSAYETALHYVVTFYPLWFTYQQWKISSVNRLVGPARMTPVYHAVVAPNDDTLYGNSVVDATKEPLIVTIPSTKDLFSVLSTDGFGNVIDTGIESAGTYGLTAPGWNGSLPAGITKVPLTANYTALIIRVDKYSSDGKNMKAEAERFRHDLRSETLSQYKKNPQGGKTNVFPVLFFGVPYKTIADQLSTKDPIAFLTQLQSAVGAASAPPFTSEEKALSNRFNALFDAKNRNAAAFIAGTRKAHEMILDCYLQNTDKANWISFTDIGTTWTSLQRSAISEFIQYGNSFATAAYFQTFKDSRGNALDGGAHSYVLTFSKREIPEAKRFWSVTAYTPGSVTLIPNAIHKYLVGSYTPGLQKGKTGSVSIYVAATQPKGVPTANWLPVAKSGFNLMLRVYGPEGKVAGGDYVPPPVRVLK